MLSMKLLKIAYVNGCRISGEEYIPLGGRDVGAVIEKIKRVSRWLF